MSIRLPHQKKMRNVIESNVELVLPALSKQLS